MLMIIADDAPAQQCAQRVSIVVVENVPALGACAKK
jgi:hypothetical protein